MASHRSVSKSAGPKLANLIQIQGCVDLLGRGVGLGRADGDEKTSYGEDVGGRFSQLLGFSPTGLYPLQKLCVGLGGKKESRPCDFVQQYMQQKLINVEHHPHKHSLVVQWNLQASQIEPPVQRHHIAIYHNQLDKINPYITTYIRHLKPPSLFSLLYSNSQLNFRYHPLRPKPSKDSLQNHYIRDRAIASGLRERMMERIEKDVEGGLTVVAVFLQHVGDGGWFEQRVREGRGKGGWQCAVALFAPWERTEMDFGVGVHRLSTRGAPGEVVPYFLGLVNSMRYEYVRLTVSSPGCTLLGSPERWGSPDFDRLERRYYSLPRYSRDVLLYETSKTMGRFTVRVEVEYQGFGGERQGQVVEVEVDTGQGQRQGQGGEREEGMGRGVYMDGFMELACNPYESVSYVKVREGLGKAEEVN